MNKNRTNHSKRFPCALFSKLDSVSNPSSSRTIQKSQAEIHIDSLSDCFVKGIRLPYGGTWPNKENKEKIK